MTGFFMVDGRYLFDWASQANGRKVGNSQPCPCPSGGPPLANHSSLLLTFDQCSRALYRRRETPVFSPLLVLTTEVHICGTVHPMVANTHRTTVMDPVKVREAPVTQTLSAVEFPNERPWGAIGEWVVGSGYRTVPW